MFVRFWQRTFMAITSRRWGEANVEENVEKSILAGRSAF